MTLLQTFEMINGTLLVIFVALVFLFARYTWLEFKNVWSWRVVRRNRAAAIAMAMVFAGECVIRGSVLVWQHFGLAQNNRPITISVAIGVSICIVGGICGLRHFAPKEWGAAPWVLVPIIGILFGIGMALN